MLPRAAYFQALAAIDSPKSPEWSATIAGLVALRLVDDWLDFGPSVVSQERGDITVVQDVIARIQDLYLLRNLLKQIVEAVKQAKQSSIQVVTPSLLRYARALEYDGKFDLAQDVLIAVQHRSEQAQDAATIIKTCLRLGFLHRRAGHFDRSREAYDKTLHYARKIGSTHYIQRAHTGQGTIAIAQGNVSFAETTFADLKIKAHKVGDTKLLTDAFHNQASLAVRLGDSRTACALLYQALEHSSNARDYDIIKGDLVNTLGTVGQHEMAKKIGSVLAVTSQQHIVRLHAMNSLMYISVLERDKAAFELHSTSLGMIPLAPMNEVWYRLDLAEGYRTFGCEAEAQAEFARVRAFAESKKIHIGYWI